MTEERTAYDGSTGPDAEHTRPAGVGDATVAAVGKVSEALECAERARGRLYDLHQLIGHADLLLGEAVDMLRDSGHEDHATRIEDEVIGRNVIAGRWTFQMVEDFDDNYWSVFRDEEKKVRDALQDGKRHVFESEMKERRRTHGKPGHSSRP